MSAAPRRMLLFAVLIGVLIAGLLGMHTLGGHEAGHADAAASAHTIAASAHEAPADAGDCGGCGELTPAQWSACVLVLLSGVLLLALPARAFLHLAPLSAAVDMPTAASAPQAPSLHVLCISRT